MVLAIDFDGVIHDRGNRPEGKMLGEPFEDAPAALEALHDAGHRIIIHTLMATTPSGTAAVTDWLDHYGIDYHEVTAIKPYADYYIDDKAITHVNWNSTMQAIGFRLDED